MRGKKTIILIVIILVVLLGLTFYYVASVRNSDNRPQEVEQAS